MNLWDKKAKTYARYQNTLNTIQKQTFEYLQNLNISFQNKSIIDIGCGTGVWTLHLAKEAKEILALDSANTMLEILQEDAKKLNLNNIKCENLSFETWMQNNPNVKFDLAFLSMSPALQNEKDYTKEEAIENALWHLSMNKITTSKEAVSSFVENDIIETIESKIKLLIINNL